MTMVNSGLNGLILFLIFHLYCVLQDGYWRLTEDVCSLVNVSAKSCEQILITAGLKSLGEYKFTITTKTICFVFHMTYVAFFSNV